MSVAIVIVNFNGGELLLESIRRCLASTVPVAVWVVDNGSTDGSLERLQVFCRAESRCHLLDLGENVGFAAACNRALEQVAGSWLLLLNPDCLIAPDTLERMMAVLMAHPDVGMAGCRIMNPGGGEQRGCRRLLPTLRTGFTSAFRARRGAPSDENRGATMNLHLQPLPDGPTAVEAISGAFMLLRPEAVRQVGRLDEGYFLHCEDLDWCRRFGDAGWKVLFVPDVEVVHYQGTCSHSRPIRVEWHKHRGMLRYFRKHLAAKHGRGTSLGVWCGVWARFSWVTLRALVRWRWKGGQEGA